MQIACLVASAVFTLFTYWQLNDLEQYGNELWYGWVASYGAVALISLTSAWRPLPRPLLYTGASLALLAALARSTAIEWQSQILYNETNPAGNETGGLLIVALWLAWLGARRSTAGARGAPSGPTA